MNAQSIQKRKDCILGAIYEHGQIQAGGLADDMGVSIATVRRDLKALAEEGLVELTHGGARVHEGSDYSFLSKSTRHVEAKRIIAALAAGLISNGEQVFLDSGTTCFNMAPHLRTRKSLSVIVNSVRTAQELHSPGLSTLILGGQYRPERMDIIGPMAVETMANLKGYRAFVGCDGLDIKTGASAVDMNSAHIFSRAVDNARESVLLADQSKFGAPTLFKVADWSSLSTLVTDKRPPSDWMAFFKKTRIRVLFPDHP